MSFFHDRQIRSFGLFLIFFAALVLGTGILYSESMVTAAGAMQHTRDAAIAASLLDSGVPKEKIAGALTGTGTSEAGYALLDALGIGEGHSVRELPLMAQFQETALIAILIVNIILVLALFGGAFLFFYKRRQLYIQADQVLKRYICGDYSGHLPQSSEGAIFQLFALVEQLATMFQSKNDNEHRTKEFLKNTISDISHQLKTPLAALTMYQEIIENEPDNPDIVRKFSAKTGAALKRMEQLIQSMLKLTRLDAGNIVFEKSCCNVSGLISEAIRELTLRAKNENKKIIMDGDCRDQLLCDMEWTVEAVGNLVKNALDHTMPGGTIHIRWERTPVMVRLFISDDGDGIAPEEIYHIFKRFYRSRHSLDTQGIGLGLPLAKSIIEGQGGTIVVQSQINEGTTFILSFLTEV